MKSAVICITTALALASVVGAVGCSRHDSSPGEAAIGQRGTLKMALETVSESGKVYRLRQAVFPVNGGNASLVLNSEDDPTRPVLETFLNVGSYEIDLLNGWFIEQVDDLLHTSAPVNATLMSSPTQFFDIQSNAETFVRFDFEVDGQRISFPPGRLIVGIGVTEREGGTPPPGMNPRRTLLETNQKAMSNFSLEQAFQAMQLNSGVTPDPVLLYQQIIDSYASPPGQIPSAAHCGDETTDGAPSLNGYPLRCDRLEHGQIDNLGQWFATAVVNRIDLAPADGAHCGQQRMVFANNVPIGNGRMFMILEAQIPNPEPQCGIDACRPIADFWASLDGMADPVQRSERLLQAFLTGAPELLARGIRPFMNVENLSVGTGTIRTNNFDDNEWTLREFKLMTDPVGQTRAIPFPVADAPHGALWNDTVALPAGEQCRQSFLQAVGGLLSDNPAEMAFVVDQACLDAESPNDFFTQNYPQHLADGSGAFRIALQDRLAGTGLTPENIAARAQFAGACMGCHEEAIGLDLGHKVTAPSSNGFVQIDESFPEDCGDGTLCFTASPALKDVFLPRRLRALTELLGRSGSCGPPAGGDGGVVPPPPPMPDGGVPMPSADAGAPPSLPLPPLPAPPDSVLTPGETIDVLVGQDKAAHTALTGDTIGGQPASVTH
jgi:hypothetical protein